ncbi:MAG: hypothetical protein LUH46_05265 [Alistipes sp.]|nr:hypothetical protein [Alistipes sp.]
MLMLLFLLLAAAVAAVTVLWLVVRGRNKRLLLAASHATAGDAPDGIGISVLCSGVRTQEQVENLLSVEYARYEVVVVLDSLRYPAEFAALSTRYHMIRVEYALSEELPVPGVRALGRSRKRRFRRLVLVDRVQDTPDGDFDAAAGVAAYDYVLPVREGQYLLPGAVGRLVAEVGEQGAGTCDFVRSRIGEPASLLSREAVVAAGGFAARAGKNVPRRRRRNLWEPVFHKPQTVPHSAPQPVSQPISQSASYSAPQSVSQPVPKPHSGLRAVAALLLAAAVVAAVWTGRWPAAAVLVTAALVWCAAGCVSLALSDIADARTGGDVKGLLRRCKIGMKNFTIS